MPKHTSNLILLLKHLSFLLIAYSVCRLLFYWFNYSYFSDLSSSQLLPLLFFGIRFDLSVIILTNSLFILLYVLPFAFRKNKVYRSILKWLFISVNSIGLFANCVDFTYFPYTLKRSNASVLNFFGGSIGNDLTHLIPVLFRDYWYIFLIGFIFICLVIRFYNKVENSYSDKGNSFNYLTQNIVFFTTLVISIVVYRGGFQLKPISTVTAGEYANVKNISLVLNTPFTILKTLEISTIEPSTTWKITDERELKKTYNPLHAGKRKDFSKLNVIVIALESFSKEYIGVLNNRKTDCTPFLDSLIGESLTFTNAFSNGKTSIDGIPAIAASIPTWMYEPYITSIYGTNQINSLANTLKTQGYYTAFFHGGTNGTMGFDAFSNIAGYDNYFGRKEYNNEKDFDGNWGIWDEEFLQYTANTINQKKQPFFATVFTLSSHHPYPIPNKYKTKFKDGILPIEKSIRYTDFALKHFFETARTMPWYKNTLFVLCADHTSVSSDPFYLNKIGNYSIPIIYYMANSNLKGLDTVTTQQIDIMPSVLDYLNYPQPYFSFGNSVFDTTVQHFAVTYNNNKYQLIQDNYVLQFDGDKATDLYNYKNDSLLKNDLIKEKSEQAKKMENHVKAIIQTYQQSLINNKMH